MCRKRRRNTPVQCFRKKNPDVCHMGKQSAAAIFKQSDECGVTRRANHIQVRVYCLLIQHDGFSCKEILACTHTHAGTHKHKNMQNESLDIPVQMPFFSYKEKKIFRQEGNMEPVEKYLLFREGT